MKSTKLTILRPPKHVSKCFSLTKRKNLKIKKETTIKKSTLYYSESQRKNYTNMTLIALTQVFSLFTNKTLTVNLKRNRSITECNLNTFDCEQ